MLPSLPSALKLFSFLPLRSLPLPFDTLARENWPLGEGAASEWRATNLRSECLKPPDLPTENLEKSEGGVSSGRLTCPPWKPRRPDRLGLACTIANTDTREVESSGIGAQEQGRTLPVVDTAPVLAESRASIEPAGMAERAMSAKSEALVPWAQDEA